MGIVSLVFMISLLVLVAGLGNDYGDKAFAQNDTKVIQTETQKQVQITSDVKNNQDKEQSFAYIVQIKNDEGVSVSLSWITGTLSPYQRMNPSLSWTPEKVGLYTVEIFVWESIGDPEPLSRPLTMKINVVKPQ